jgi:CBS domain-containing protein
VIEAMTSVFNYSVVNENATIEEAITTLNKSYFLDEHGNAHGHTSLLVTNDSGELTGILTLRSLLEALVLAKKNITSTTDPNYIWFLFIKFSQMTAGTIPVKAVMRTKDLIFVRSDSDLMDAVELMVEKQINSLPVLNGADRLVGILRTKDIFGMINDLL